MATLRHLLVSIFVTYSLLSYLMQQTLALCPNKCTCKLVPNPIIDCSKANLDSLPPELSHYRGETIEELNLSHNKNLKTLKQGAFNGLNISVLKLSSTGIRSLKPGVFSGVKVVNTLYLDRNNIVYTKDENPLSGLERSLEYLQLQGQGLEEVPHFIKQMYNLIEVDLSDNNIQELNDGSLSMIKAKRVILQRNRMHTVSKSALVSTKPKELVDLSFNEIRDLSFLWDYCKAEKIDLSENPIHCHCDLVVYRKAMSSPQVNGLCASPPRLQGTGVMSQDFLAKASGECGVRTVTPITCPGPEYRWNMYTQTTGSGGGIAHTILVTSGARRHTGAIYLLYVLVTALLVVLQ